MSNLEALESRKYAKDGSPTPKKWDTKPGK